MMFRTGFLGFSQVVFPPDSHIRLFVGKGIVSLDLRKWLGECYETMSPLMMQL